MSNDDDFIESGPKPTNVGKYSINGDIFEAIEDSASALPAGIYEVKKDYNGRIFFFKKADNTSTTLLRFDDTAGDYVIKELESFWHKKDSYIARGESHKRGYLLHGPPGGGKSSIVTWIINDFIQQGYPVFLFNANMIDGIELFRKIEPDRKMMIIIEDIDGFLNDTSLEQKLLQFLDGSLQLVNTAIIATTNFPEELPSRIKNRPSRFDRLISIGFPNETTRKTYIAAKSKTLDEIAINEWVNETEGMSLAHIKELITAVEIFDLDFYEELDRIRDMMKETDNSADYPKPKTRKLGFK